MTIEGGALLLAGLVQVPAGGAAHEAYVAALTETIRREAAQCMAEGAACAGGATGVGGRGAGARVAGR